MAGVIDDYLSGLRRDLAFDRALSRRVCEEVEAHLRDAAESDPAWPSAEAERRAIARFGAARDIAAQFASDSVKRQTSRTWLILLAAVFATFLAMRLRVMWLEGVDDPVSMLAPLVDRYGFVAAVSAAVIGWWAFRRSTVPLILCVVTLAASIAGGIVRADLLASPTHVVAGTACEVALLGMLSIHVAGLHLRLRRTANLRSEA
jgi:hypothetical protein